MSTEYESIFSGGDNQQGEPAGQGDNQALRINALGRTWSVEDAAKKIEAAEEFIETLKREKRELEEKANSAVKLEEVMKAMKERDSDGALPTNNVGPEELKAQVLAALRAEELEKVAKENFKKSEEIVKATFGEAWASKLEVVAKESGLTPDKLKGLMMESPTLISRLIGSQGSHTPVPTGSSVNAAAILGDAKHTHADALYAEAKSNWMQKRDQASFQTMLKHKFSNLNRS
jgi:hypothetical protein